MVVDENTKSRIEDALFSDGLMSLFEEMEAEGLGQKELEETFTDFLRQINQEESREKDAEKVTDLLDGITGYCHPEGCLFPPERYQSHRGIIRFFAAGEDRKSVLRFIFEKTSFRVFRDYSYESGELEYKSVEDIDFSEATRFYIWSEVISSEYSIHEQWYEHLQKTCYSFISDPTFPVGFGKIEQQIIEPSYVTHAFRRYPTAEAFQSIEPIRSYIDELHVTTAIGVPVLPETYSLVKQGFELKESPRTRWDYKLDLL